MHCSLFLVIAKIKPYTTIRPVVRIIALIYDLVTGTVSCAYTLNHHNNCFHAPWHEPPPPPPTHPTPPPPIERDISTFINFDFWLTGYAEYIFYILYITIVFISVIHVNQNHWRCVTVCLIFLLYIYIYTYIMFVVGAYEHKNTEHCFILRSIEIIGISVIFPCFALLFVTFMNEYYRMKIARYWPVTQCSTFMGPFICWRPSH